MDFASQLARRAIARPTVEALGIRFRDPRETYARHDPLAGTAPAT